MREHKSEKEQEITQESETEILENSDKIETDIREINREREEVMKEMEKENQEIKPTDQKKFRDRMITTYGEVELDSQERQFLALGPEFTMLENIERRKLKVNFQTALTKIRWSSVPHWKEPQRRSRIGNKKTEVAGSYR